MEGVCQLGRKTPGWLCGLLGRGCCSCRQQEGRPSLSKAEYPCFLWRLLTALGYVAEHPSPQGS